MMRNDLSEKRAEPSLGQGEAGGARATLLEAAVRAGVEASEIGANAAALLRVHGDRARWKARRVAVQLFVAALAFIGLSAVIATAGAHLVSGACQLLGARHGALAGSGDVAGGALTLLVIAAGVAAAIAFHARRALRRKEAEYDELHRKHVERFGTGQDPAPTQE